MIGNKTKVIAIEGPDRVGKATQSLMLVAHLRLCGYKVALIEVPVFSNVVTYKLIYWMLKNGLAETLPTMFQLVHFLNKYLFQELELKRMTEFDYVVFDRWRLSSLVYGSLTGSIGKCVQYTYDKLVQPDMTIVLHGASYKREEEEDVYERNVQLQRQVTAAYVRWTEDNPVGTSVAADGSQMSVHKSIIDALQRTNLL